MNRRPSLSRGTDKLTGPNLVGLDEDRARNTLEQAKFTSINSRQVDSLEKKGTVVAVSPVEGSQAAPNSPIRLQISTGTVPLPNVSNKSEDEARRILTQAGFRAGQIVNQNVERDDLPAGTVVGPEPGTGTAVGAGDEIVLLITVSTPPETSSPTPTPTPATTPPAPPSPPRLRTPQ